jgi:hypothetical protein
MKSVCENFNIPFKHFSLHIFFESTFDIHREFYEHFPIIIDDQCPLQLQQLKDKLDIERLLFISNQRNVPTRTLQALLSSFSHPISAYRLQQTKKELDSQLDRLFPLLQVLTVHIFLQSIFFKLLLFIFHLLLNLQFGKLFFQEMEECYTINLV